MSILIHIVLSDDIMYLAYYKKQYLYQIYFYVYGNVILFYMHQFYVFKCLII